MSVEVAGLGENYVSGELERRGWITCIPTRDVGIDRVAFKLTKGKFKYLFIQVKTATWSDKSQYTLTVRKTKAYEDPHFLFIFALDDLKSRVKFLVLSTKEWKEMMGSKLNTQSWIQKGAYTFHIRKDLGRWREHLNAFEKIENL